MLIEICLNVPIKTINNPKIKIKSFPFSAIVFHNTREIID